MSVRDVDRRAPPDDELDATGAPSVRSELAAFWEQTTAILWKDLRLELRSRETWFSMGLFALLALLIFNFAFELRVDTLVAVGPGALWIALIFASLLGLGRTLASEQERGSLDRLLICPVDRKAIYLAKLLGNLIFIGVVELVAVPVFATLYNLSVLNAQMLVTLALGTFGVATVGTLVAALAAAARSREALLPLLLFPLIVPIVIGAVKATQAILSPTPGGPPWLGLIAAFDVIFFSVATVTFPYVVEE